PDAHGRTQPYRGRGHGRLALCGGPFGARRRRSRSGRRLHRFGRRYHDFGGYHVTMDLDRGLNTRIADAERIKAIYGSVLTGGSDERDMISVPPVGDDEREPPQF